MIANNVIKLDLFPCPKYCSDYNCIKFLVRLHGEYNILVKLCGNTT